MTNDFWMGVYNLFDDPLVTISSSSLAAGYSLAALRDGRLTRGIQFDGNENCSITLGCADMNPLYRKCDTLIVALPNVKASPDGVFQLQAHTDDVWSSPNIDLTGFIIPNDQDTTDYWWKSQALPAPYPFLFFPLGQDILASNDWIHFLISDPSIIDNLSLAKMFLGLNSASMSFGIRPMKHSWAKPRFISWRAAPRSRRSAPLHERKRRRPERFRRT